MDRPHTPGFLKLVHEAKRDVHEITIDDYHAMLASGEPHRLIDVREDNEFAAAHAAAAMHVGKGVIERDIETVVPNPDEKLVLYCGGGYRSALAAQAIQKMGYRNVLSLDGGWTAYEASGLPVTRG